MAGDKGIGKTYGKITLQPHSRADFCFSALYKRRIGPFIGVNQVAGIQADMIFFIAEHFADHVINFSAFSTDLHGFIPCGHTGKIWFYHIFNSIFPIIRKILFAADIHPAFMYQGTSHTKTNPCGIPQFQPLVVGGAPQPKGNIKITKIHIGMIGFRFPIDHQVL